MRRRDLICPAAEESAVNNMAMRNKLQIFCYTLNGKIYNVILLKLTKQGRFMFISETHSIQNPLPVRATCNTELRGKWRPRVRARARALTSQLYLFWLISIVSFLNSYEDQIQAEIKTTCTLGLKLSWSKYAVVKNERKCVNLQCTLKLWLISSVKLSPKPIKICVIYLQYLKIF